MSFTIREIAAYSLAGITATIACLAPRSERENSSEPEIIAAAPPAARQGTAAATGTMDVYYPGTETLGPNEMRVVACGTGMPNARPKQAAACWMVELGNGDKFIFDVGLGSAERIAAQKIPYDLLDKVFLGHLHADHIGDLDSLWIGRVTGNRVKP